MSFSVWVWPTRFDALAMMESGFRGHEEVSPLAEGEAAKIVAQRRVAPALAAIDRYLNTSDAVSAIGIVTETGQVSTRGRASL